METSMCLESESTRRRMKRKHFIWISWKQMTSRTSSWWKNSKDISNKEEQRWSLEEEMKRHLIVQQSSTGKQDSLLIHGRSRPCSIHASETPAKGPKCYEALIREKFEKCMWIDIKGGRGPPATQNEMNLVKIIERHNSVALPLHYLGSWIRILSKFQSFQTLVPSWSVGEIQAVKLWKKIEEVRVQKRMLWGS